MLLAFAALYHRLAAYLLNEGVAHIGKGGVPVHVKLLFHFGNAVLYHFKLVFVKLQLFVDVGIVLNKLRRRKSGGHIRNHGVILNHMGHGVYAAVYRPVTEVKLFGLFLFFGAFDDLGNKFVDTLVFSRAYWKDGYTQPLGKSLNINSAAVVPHLIHHIQRKHHGYVHFQHLQGEIEIALNIGGVGDIYDRVGFFVDEEIPRHYLLVGIGAYGIYARQVNHFAVFASANLAGFSVHRYSGEVPHVLVGTCKLVEQSGLAAVLISRKSKYHTVTASFALSGTTVIFSASSRRMVSS